MRVTGKAKPIAPRFWAKVDKGVIPDSCWVWTGCVDESGYGLMSCNNEVIRTHRISWELHFGPIPKGEGWHGTCVLHTCDNPSCVNPKHLFLGTIKDNNRDCKTKGRKASTSGINHPKAKLTEDIVREIRKSKLPQITLAWMYNVDGSVINKVIKGTRWAHVQ